MKLRRIGTALTAASALAGAMLGAVPGALAQTYGHAVSGQLGLQPSVTPIGAEIHSFHNLVLAVITVISVFVLALLVYVIWRFNERANPVASRTTHHTMLEVAWTVVPVLILVIIAIPSFRLLTHQLVLPKADMTVKVTGKQWYWSYDYPKEEGDFGFDSILKAEADLDSSKGDIRLLSVDNEAVVPVGKVVRFQVTAADVIHSFVVPAFGIRIDAVPGRLNETWFKAEREGIYYGQCSKLCGKDHAFMPIAVRVVSEQQYQAWRDDAKKKFASRPSETTFADAAAPARQ
jgi:cytochrome c oxidase subunit 2